MGMTGLAQAWLSKAVVALKGTVVVPEVDPKFACLSHGVVRPLCRFQLFMVQRTGPELLLVEHHFSVIACSMNLAGTLSVSQSPFGVTKN